MWYDIFPSFLLVTAGLGIPHIFAPLLNYVVNRNIFRRALNEPHQRLMYLRDRRISGNNPYKVCGLENIPDCDCCYENVDEQCCEDVNEDDMDCDNDE